MSRQSFSSTFKNAIGMLNSWNFKESLVEVKSFESSDSESSGSRSSELSRSSSESS